jgi:GH43 family beta-xylosidase
MHMMLTRWSRWWIACLAGAVLAWSACAAAAPASTFNNPLVPLRADPQVLLHTDGYYYFVATVPEYDRIELRRARTLDGLASAETRVVWRQHASGPMSAHIWAPELHLVDGKWTLYFSAGRADAVWDIHLYVLDTDGADPLTATWTERGQLKTGQDTFAIDATTFVNAGQRYLVWSARDLAGPKATNLYIATMANATTTSSAAVLISRPDYDWEKAGHAVNEAPALLAKNGRLFLTYSASATDARYAMGMLTARADANLLDPAAWRKSPVPVFQSSAANGQYGPGHNSFTTSADGKTDVLVYHARNYRDIVGDPLRDPNRATRAQEINWRADGTPDFGVPVADAGKVAAKPLFVDPVFDGAADPVVIRNVALGRWWMLYTNRRANVAGLPGFAWVHGTPIGIAESSDEGATWTYIGTADIKLPEAMGGKEATLWAPDVVRADDGVYHMFLTVVPGTFTDWQHPRQIVHLTSADLRHWDNAQVLALASDRLIDASVARMADGSWRLWYNNERDKKSIYYADSLDLAHWTDRGRAVGDQSGEGPKIFRWHDSWWMITDVWRGLAVYRSDDAVHWQRQPDNLVQAPGTGVDDEVAGGHPDVVVNGERAWLFYFTHPGRRGADAKADGPLQRRSVIQVAELTQVGNTLTVQRDGPARMRLGQ